MIFLCHLVSGLLLIRNLKQPDTVVNAWLSGRKSSFLVNVTGCVDEIDPFSVIDEPIGADKSDLLGPCTCRVYQKGSFVHYRHPVDRDYGLHLCVACSGLNMCDGNVGKQIIIDMRSFRVRPSHYSLRGADCGYMDADWTFKGSTDGEHWECLHQGQEDCYIGQLSVNTWEILADRLSINVDTGVLNNEQRAYLTDQAEERLRGTWAVPDNKSNGFYRFFRIQKVGDKGCLHATSFEFFGDVNECPDD